MRCRLIIAVWIAVVGWWVCVPAASIYAKVTAINALNKVEPSRARALGGAATAIGYDSTLVWVNPASTAQANRSSITFAGQRGHFREITGQGLWTKPYRKGILTLGVMYYDTGSMNFRASDGSLRQMTLQQDFVGSVSYAGAISPRMNGGFTLKGIRSQLFGKASASALAGDAGWQMRLTKILKMGMAIQNVGTKLTYLDEAVSLPTATRVGFAIGARMAQLGLSGAMGRDVLIFMGDAELPLHEPGMTLRGGIEYQWRGILALRAGAHRAARVALSNYSAGLGFHLGQYRLDYSIRFGGVFEVPQTFSLTVALPQRTALPASMPITAPPPLSTATPQPIPTTPPLPTALPVMPLSPSSAVTAPPEPESPTRLPAAPPPEVESAPERRARNAEGALIEDLNR